MAAFPTSPPRRVRHSCLWRITEERSEFEVKYTVYQPIQIQRGIKYDTYFLWDYLQNSYFRFSIFLLHHEDIDYWSNLCTSPHLSRPHFCPPLGKMCSISVNLKDATMNQRWACSLKNALRKGYFRFPNIWIDHEYIDNRRNLWTYPPFRRFLVVRKWRGGLIGHAGIFEVHERSGLNNW